MDAASIATLLVAILGAGGGGALITKWWESKRADRKEQSDQFLVLIGKLELRVQHLEGEHAICMKLKEEQAGILGEFREKVRRLEVEVENARLAQQRIAQSCTIVADKDGDVVHWPKAAEHMLGFTVEDMAGSALDSLFPLAQRREIADRYAAAASASKPVCSCFEATARHKSGTAVRVMLQLSSGTAKSGAWLAFAEVSRLG